MRVRRQISIPRTVATWVGLPVATTVFGSAAMISAYFGARALPESASRAWARWLLKLAGIELEVSIAAGADPEATYVLVGNHQSHFDVPCIMAAWPGPVRFVAKRSLFAIPLFGQALAAVGHISVVRGDSEQARAALRKAIGPLQQWVSVLFFAEGTRSRDGRLQPFKKGCLAMAESAQVPVAPVGVLGTRAVLPRDSGWIAPGVVRIHFGAPVEGMQSTDRPRSERIEVLRAAVARAMEEARSSS